MRQRNLTGASYFFRGKLLMYIAFNFQNPKGFIFHTVADREKHWLCGEAFTKGFGKEAGNGVPIL